MERLATYLTHLAIACSDIRGWFWGDRLLALARAGSELIGDFEYLAERQCGTISSDEIIYKEVCT